MAPSRRAKKSYHHGDLAAALVQAGLTLVEEQGIEAVSLRAVARLAAVSHSAPYHHFATKAELLAAIAAAGFDRMVATIGKVADERKAQSPLDGLRAVGTGYLRFALANPGVFRLMFRPELTRPSEHPVLGEAEARAFGTLLSTIIGCQQGGQLPATDPRLMAAVCWSTVHGLAVLHVEQVLGETPLGELRVEELARYVVEAATMAPIHTPPPSPAKSGTIP
jgi:AcrR family transcriptional regulator